MQTQESSLPLKTTNTWVRLWPWGQGDLWTLALTCLRGFPAGLLDVFFDLVAELHLQLLSLQLQLFLPVSQGFSGLPHERRLRSGTRSQHPEQNRATFYRSGHQSLPKVATVDNRSLQWWKCSFHKHSQFSLYSQSFIVTDSMTNVLFPVRSSNAQLSIREKLFI